MDRIETEMTDIKKKMQTEKVKSLDIETTDSFTLDFIKASYFTAQDYDERPMLQHVNITENEIQAIDGYRKITIENDEIPEELKNTKIMWDVRENFKDHISKIEGKYPDTSSVEPKKEDIKYTLENVTSENFYDHFTIKNLKESRQHTVVLTYKGFIIAFNKEFLDMALTTLKEEIFTVYFTNNVTPVILESERIKVLVLPKRLLDGWENEVMN
jgi:DNA polymerase III sliding clamp (beta) subunit (PCNA family)